MERVHWQLRLSPGSVTSGERVRAELWERREDGREAENAICFNLSKQRCIAFFSSSFVSERPRRREVLAFCAAFVLWPAEKPSGKPEWAGGGAISSIKFHSVSSTGVYFLFICRMRDMDTSLSLSSLPRSSPLALPTTLSFVFFLYLSQLTSSAHMKVPKVCFCCHMF